MEAMPNMETGAVRPEPCDPETVAVCNAILHGAGVTDLQWSEGGPSEAIEMWLARHPGAAQSQAAAVRAAASLGGHDDGPGPRELQERLAQDSLLALGLHYVAIGLGLVETQRQALAAGAAVLGSTGRSCTSFCCNPAHAPLQ